MNKEKNIGSVGAAPQLFFSLVVVAGAKRRMFRIPTPQAALVHERAAQNAQGCAKFHFQIGQASANFMPFAK